MRGKNTLFSAAVILLVLGSPVFAYQQIIDLGTLGGKGSCAYSINDKGQIIGWADYNPNTDSGGSKRACLFDATGGGANISLQSGSLAFGVAQSINNNGQIVGWALSYPGGNEYACLFDPTGGGANKTLVSSSSIASHAYSINDNGQIVGYFKNNSSQDRACIFDPTGNGANKDLGTLGGTQSCAFSVNNNGIIVGSAYLNSTFPYISHACLFDSSGNGANIDLGTLGDNTTAYANAINNNNQIVGYTYKPGLPVNNIHACLFDSSGNIDLGTLGMSGAEATSINDLGQIVGWSMYSNAPPHACLFDPTGQGNNIDLNTLIDQSSGWTLNYAYCINNSGWIVGQGTYNGYARAFLLTPEPATLLFFGLGISLLRRKK